MKLLWQPNAQRDRERIYRYINADAPKSARQLDLIFKQAALGLIDYPERGRSGRMAGTRELVVHPNYILVYRVKPDLVEILTILHAAQLWP